MSDVAKKISDFVAGKDIDARHAELKEQVKTLKGLHDDEITRLRAENERLREALIDTIASLVASVSLLERGGKNAAPSDTMFAQMLVDYKNSIDRARAALESMTETPNVP